MYVYKVLVRVDLIKEPNWTSFWRIWDAAQIY